MLGRYDFGYEVYHGSTVEWALQQIKPYSDVLEFGPFNGNLTKHLTENLSCRVDIVELDQKAGEVAERFARDALIGANDGDIEAYVWEKKYKGRKYDYIVFLDVIEHLISTEEVLLRIQPFLKKEGLVLLSIPNIAYNGVIMNLLKNRFPYTERGLLDCTHLRFFTYESISELAVKLNYSYEIQALQLPISDSEIDVAYDMVPEGVSHYLQQRKYANVYQYLVKLKNGRSANCDKELQLENIDNNILVCVYVQTDRDVTYTEEQKAWVYVQAGNYLHATLDLSSFNKVQRIRLDPMECPCYLKNISVMAQRENGEEIKLSIKETNAVTIGDCYLFPTDDSQLFFELNNEKIVSIVFSCELLTYDRKEIESLYKLYIWKRNNFKCIEEELNTVRVQLKETQENQKKIEDDLKREKTEHENIKQQLFIEKNYYEQTRLCLDKERKLRIKTQIEMDRLRSDLQRVLEVKDQSEQKLYLIENSKTWLMLQRIIRLKEILLRRKSNENS